MPRAGSRAYTRLSRGREYDPRFDAAIAQSHRKHPWKKLALAAGLLLAGIALFAVAYLCLTKHLGTSELDVSRGYGFAALGALVFIPGFYHSRLAYYALKVRPQTLATWHGAKTRCTVATHARGARLCSVRACTYGAAIPVVPASTDRRAGLVPHSHVRPRRATKALAWTRSLTTTERAHLQRAATGACDVPHCLLPPSPGIPRRIN